MTRERRKVGRKEGRKGERQVKKQQQIYRVGGEKIPILVREELTVPYLESRISRKIILVKNAK